MEKRSKKYSNTMRYLRQSHGQCCWCGADRESDPRATKWMCGDCRDWKRRHGQKLRAERIEAGLCRDCKAPRGANGTKNYCRTCADKINAAIKQMRADLVANGLCRQCRRPLRNRHSVCTPCLAEWSRKGWNGAGYERRNKKAAALPGARA